FSLLLFQSQQLLSLSPSIFVLLRGSLSSIFVLLRGFLSLAATTAPPPSPSFHHLRVVFSAAISSILMFASG
ncbi:hypothetical protein SOVF_205290 isoform B, partial [Spinacia oleracea]